MKCPYYNKDCPKCKKEDRPAFHVDDKLKSAATKAAQTFENEKCCNECCKQAIQECIEFMEQKKWEWVEMTNNPYMGTALDAIESAKEFLKQL